MTMNILTETHYGRIVRDRDGNIMGPSGDGHFAWFLTSEPKAEHGFSGEARRRPPVRAVRYVNIFASGYVTEPEHNRIVDEDVPRIGVITPQSIDDIDILIHRLADRRTDPNNVSPLYVLSVPDNPFVSLPEHLLTATFADRDDAVRAAKDLIRVWHAEMA